MNVSNARAAPMGTLNALVKRIKRNSSKCAARRSGCGASTQKACDDALKALVEGAFLHRTASGAYSRR